MGPQSKPAFESVQQTQEGRNHLWTSRPARCGLLLVCLIATLTGCWYFFIRPTDAQLLQNAIRFADLGQREAAIGLLDQVLKRNPTESTALLYRGRLARESGDVAAAARFWNRVPDKPARKGAKARMLEATLYRDADRARDAETALLKAVELDPDCLEAHELLLQLYILKLRETGIGQELEAIRRIRPLTPSELYELVFRDGIAPDRDLNIPPALVRFTEADPGDVDSQVALARYSVKYHDRREAAALLQKALSRKPGDASILAYLAEVLLAQGNSDGARDALMGAPTTDNAPPCVWKSHGLYWLAAGDWRRAAACLRRYRATNPNDLAVEYHLMLAVERAGDTQSAERQSQHVRLLQQLQDAMSFIQQSAEKTPSAIFIPLVQIGKRLMTLNRPAAAVAFFETAMAIDPNAELARENRALARERLSGSAAAEDDTAADEFTAFDLAVPRPVQAEGTGSAEAKHTLTADPAVGKQEMPRLLFVDRHQDVGLEYQYFNGANGKKLLLETTGGGVAVLDYDGDGWPDLFFPQGCRIPFDRDDATFTDRLFRNLESGAFIDITVSAGLTDNQFSQGCAAGDYDNDGFPDLAVGNFGTNAIYHNNGDGTFTDVSVVCGIGGTHWTTSLAWGDLDRDGNLDLYVVNYVRDPWISCPDKRGIVRVCNPHRFEAEADVLYMNRGDGSFEDVTRAAGIASFRGRGLGVVIADLDDDGWPEVFVANDGDPNFLFQHLSHDTGGDAGQGLKFTERALLAGTSVRSDGVAQAAMGIACSDLDGDGRLDLYVTNFYREADSLYLNRGELLFEDTSVSSGLAEPTRFMLGWGAQAVDVDLDGRRDLFQTNGHLDDLRDEGHPWKMPSQLFYNLGQGRFAEVSHASGDFFAGAHLGRGVARLDWNRDGRPDLVVVYQDRLAALLRNETRTTGNRLILELRGVQSNRDAIGARIRVSCAGTTQVLEICGGDGYAATNERRQIVGIGQASRVNNLEIRWPSGRQDCWRDIPANSVLLLIEGQPPRISEIDGDRADSQD